MSEFNQVRTFNKDILGIAPRALGIQSEDEYRLSYTQMREECEEFLQACNEDDFIGAIDAVIDNMVFSMGVLYKLGLTELKYTEIFKAVMDANMSKKKGVKKGREGFNAADAMKPEGWIAPEDRIAEILK